MSIKDWIKSQLNVDQTEYFKQAMYPHLEKIKNEKRVRTPFYNYTYNTETGFFKRWGKTKEDDPAYSPIGPEILDMEISTICSGINGVPCKHCYKSNTSKGKNMSFETFKTIFDKMPSITQIAFGIGDIDAHPDLFKIFEYCRSHRNVAPNLTTNGWGMTPEIANKLSKFCGAIAVSRYDERDVCYNAVKMLTDAGMDQINIHMMVSKETEHLCWEVMEDSKKDKRLELLNAIVFLSYKPKGRGIVNEYNRLEFDNFKKIVNYGLQNNISIGFDSCGAPIFAECIKGDKELSDLMIFVECCESSLFSAYINVDGNYFPCSFVEDEHDWRYGIDVVNCNDFLEDVWFNDKTKKFRKLLTFQGEMKFCPYYDLYGGIDKNFKCSDCNCSQENS